MSKTRSNLEYINTHFKLPISWNEQKVELNDNIITDLELKKTYDLSGTPIYDYVFQSKTPFGKKITEQHTQYYTTDLKYLKDTQTLYKKFKSIQPEGIHDKYLEIMKIWDDIKLDTHFKERYHYLEWNNTLCNKLNSSSEFLQLMSLYNLASPVMSLLMPIFILIVPFFIIQMKGMKLTLTEYITILKRIANKNAIGQLFTQYGSVSNEKKLYLVISAVFYVFSIYQNILTCIRFHKNMTKIHNYFQTIKDYIIHTEEQLTNLLLYTSDLNTYSGFNLYATTTLSTLTELKEELQLITPYSLTINKMYQMGHIMKVFYTLFTSDKIHTALLWSFGLNGYIDTIEGITKNIHQRHMSFCKLQRRNKKMKKKGQPIVFKNAYYPVLKEDNPIQNDIYLNKNLIITGPNASGKTTILKSTLLNVILSQQLGCGFYSSANLVPYKYIHCYLNIPDTSGRDSLFQAEARRCKDILDVIHDNMDERHFCVFDELYSGTNPDEAVISAKSFMQYLVKIKGVNCMLTTHFINLCKHLEDNTLFHNCHMDTKTEEGNPDHFHYTYCLKDGISNVRGGMKVLRDMNYPKEIIEG